jgi:hypothetical protein
MVQVLNFYMDDSGTRHPDHHINFVSTRPDWFALGGILVREDDEDYCRAMHHTLCTKWNLTGPLHSEEIRNSKKNFKWLNKDPQKRTDFLVDLEAMLVEMPVIGIACVIDRRGYHRRYDNQYGRNKWSLCRSAFEIGVERAGKYARAQGLKLNVLAERSDEKTDRRLEEHFHRLKRDGNSFNVGTSSKYDPLSRSELGETLYDFRMKTKSSAMMQIADLYLYPMTQARYRAAYRPYEALVKHQKLIDCHVADVNQLGVKYYCFDAPSPEKTEAEALTASASGQPSEEDLVG